MVAKPKGDVPGNLAFEGQRLKDLGKVFPFTDYRQEDSQNEDKPQKGHLFARQGNNKTNAYKKWLALHRLMTINI